MAINYEPAVAQDLNLGFGTVAVTMPAGGTALGSLIGIHTFLRQHFSVRDFGAVGDGSHDDTAAIQNAIATAQTLGGSIGGVVALPAGAYRLSAPLVIAAPNVQLVGDGMGATILWLTSPTLDGIQVTAGLGGVVLRDFTIAPAPTVTRLGGSGITVSGAGAAPILLSRIDGVATVNQAVGITLTQAAALWIVDDCCLITTGPSATAISISADASVQIGAGNTFVGAFLVPVSNLSPTTHVAPHTITAYLPWNPGALVAGGAPATLNVVVLGVAAGDVAVAGLDTIETTPLLLSAAASLNAVTVTLWNPAGATFPAGTGNLRITVFHHMPVTVGT